MFFYFFTFCISYRKFHVFFGFLWSCWIWVHHSAILNDNYQNILMSDRKKSTIRTIVSDRGEAISRWLMFTLNDSAYRWFFPPVYRSLSLLIVKCEPSFNDTYRWLFSPAYRSLSVSVNRALGINMFTMTGWYKKVISSAATWF